MIGIDQGIITERQETFGEPMGGVLLCATLFLQLGQGFTPIRAAVCTIPLSVGVIIGSALGRLEKQIGPRTIKIEAPQDLPVVPMDGLLIEQVLVNLLDNALKYTPQDSPVELSAGVEGPWMNVKVFDRGPGLTEDDLAHVFDKFYRGQAQRLAGGTGLGLSVCKGILDLHEGKIEAFNRPGGGAVFQFSLPMELKA